MPLVFLPRFISLLRGDSILLLHGFFFDQILFPRQRCGEFGNTRCDFCQSLTRVSGEFAEFLDCEFHLGGNSLGFLLHADWNPFLIRFELPGLFQIVCPPVRKSFLHFRQRKGLDFHPLIHLILHGSPSWKSLRFLKNSDGILESLLHQRFVFDPSLSKFRLDALNARLQPLPITRRLCAHRKACDVPTFVRCERIQPIHFLLQIVNAFNDSQAAVNFSEFLIQLRLIGIGSHGMQRL